jgi:hypothetical protein
MIITSQESAAVMGASGAVDRIGANALETPSSAPTVLGARALYEQLWNANANPDAPLQQGARAFIKHWLEASRQDISDLPASPDQLQGWLQTNLNNTGACYKDYLAKRKAGAPRQYFTSRSHALYFLRSVAPTKLVDGVWLYGLLRDGANPRLSDLIFTYIEELGDGDPDKNHVLLYRRLLNSLGIVDWAEQPDSHYVQGALQLALAACTETMLPEIIGFNLGYEQLPLHLLITAYELDGLGIDPTYFSLHVTVDNAAGGHAQRALRTVVATMPGIADREEFWKRLEDGYRLSTAGWGTTDAIASFNVHAELARVIEYRAAEGQVAHSDYCRIEGKTVNQWLATPGGASAFAGALERKGWLQRGSDPSQSRFWRMLQGDSASMFGVFGDYELQVIYDWIRGDAAADGAPFVRGMTPSALPQPARSFRHARRLAAARPSLALSDLSNVESELDADVVELRNSLIKSNNPRQRGELIRQLLGPALHWGSAGLEATRCLSDSMRAVK